jgi:DNA-binding LacI/PurR family transcriptional regulator
MLVDKVAQNWGVSRRTVYRLINDKLIPSTITKRKITVECQSIDYQLVTEVNRRLQRYKKRNTSAIKKILNEIKQNKEKENQTSNDRTTQV